MEQIEIISNENKNENENEITQKESYSIDDNDSLYNINLDNIDKKYLLIDSNMDEIDNSLLSQKSGFGAHLQEKLLKFYNQQRLLEHKLTEVKNNKTTIIILLLLFSSVLTIIESFRGLYKFSDYGISIVISTIITFLSAFSKIMKHQEIVEELVKSLEKCLITQVELKKVQESLIFCNNKKTLDEIKTNFLNNTFISYLNCEMEIFKAVPKNQQNKIVKEIYQIDCQLRESYRDKLVKLHKIENDINTYNDTIIKIRDSEVEL